MSKTKRKLQIIETKLQFSKKLELVRLSKKTGFGIFAYDHTVFCLQEVRGLQDLQMKFLIENHTKYKRPSAQGSSHGSESL